MYQCKAHIRKANKGDMMGHISITFNARVKVPFFGFEIWWQIYNSDFVTTNCDHVYFRNYCKQIYKAIKQNLCPMPWQFNAPHNKKTRRKGSIKICSCCMIKIIYWFYIMYFIFYYYSTIEKIVSLIVIFLYFISITTTPPSTSLALQQHMEEALRDTGFYPAPIV